MKKLTSTERVALLLLAALLLAFLTVRLTQYYAREGEIEHQTVETTAEMPAITVISTATTDSTTRHRTKKQQKSHKESRRKQPSSPKSRDYLDQPIN